MTKQASVVTAREIGDKNSRSRAIVLRQGAGKRDSSILWVSSRDGFLCSCFSGHENALFLSASSRSTTCSHTVALRKALSSSGVSSGTFCSRMRLRADAAEFAVCEDYGSTVLWSVLYHSVFSLVMFSSGNVATCVAPCCRRFRGRCGHVRVARLRLGPDGFNDPKIGTAPAAVKARADARRPTPRVYEKVVNNEEEDEGLEKLASDTMRGPLDSAPIDLAARVPRNLLPCSGEVNQGKLWNRTADWRTLLRQRPAGAGQATAKQLSLVLESSLQGGFIRDTTQPLVKPTCGSCGQKREPRHQVDVDPGLLSTHHPTAAPLKVMVGRWTCNTGECSRIVEYDGSVDGLFSMQRRNRAGRWLIFTRGLIDKLLSFIISGRTTYTAATRHLSADVLSFNLRRQDVVKVGTAAIKTFRIPTESARCPICGPSPEFIVIDAQALGCSDPDDTVPLRPAEDCPVLNIPAPKLCTIERAPLRIAITKILRTSAPLTTAQVDLLRAWRDSIGAAGQPSVEAAAATVFFRFFPFGREPAASQTAPGEPQRGGGSDTAAGVDTRPDESGRPQKRARTAGAGGLEAALRLDKDGNVVLGGAGPPVKKPTDTWRNRTGHCAPAFDRYPRNDDGLWICVRPFLQAMLTETVTGMFQAFDERAVRLLANTLRLMRRGTWRSLTKAVDGVGFVAGFLGWFADLIDEEPRLRQAIGQLLLAAVNIEKYVDDTFKEVANDKKTLAAGWKNAAYCKRWEGQPTTADYKQWRAEQLHLGDLDEDDPLISFEYFAGLPRVRPGITDSEAVKRRVQYRGKDRHKADLEGEGDACNKAFSIKAGLTQGVFNVVCPHVITLGFRCLFRAESVEEALSIVLERFSKLPKAIFYDVACKLDKNAMRRVRQLMRAHGVRCILDRPHSITHSFSPIYMPDECLGTTAGVATQAAEVSHSIAVVNRTSLAYMSPATYMYHRMVQVAFVNVRKLFRLQESNGSGENDHVPLAPFFHKKIAHQCERAAHCTCASTVGDGCKDVSKAFDGHNLESTGSQLGHAGRGGPADAVVAATPDNSGVAARVDGDPWVSSADEESGYQGERIEVLVGAGHAERGGTEAEPLIDKADGRTVLRHTQLLSDFDAWVGARRPSGYAAVDTRRVSRAQVQLVNELTSRQLGKAVRPINKARILLRGADFHRLVGEAWMNDELLNSFVALINHRARAAAQSDEEQPAAGLTKKLRVVMFSTFFFSRLSTRHGSIDYDGVRRWGVKFGLDLNAVDAILVPILEFGSHWLLVCINVTKREFHYYDSLSTRDSHNHVAVLQQWMHEEVNARLGPDVAADWDVFKWGVVCEEDLPRQRDSGSCGIFVLAAANCFSLGAPLAFTQADIRSLRQRIALSLFFDGLSFPDDIPLSTCSSATTTPTVSDDERMDTADAHEVEDVDHEAGTVDGRDAVVDNDGEEEGGEEGDDAGGGEQSEEEGADDISSSGGEGLVRVDETIDDGEGDVVESVMGGTVEDTVHRAGGYGWGG